MKPALVTVLDLGSSKITCLVAAPASPTAPLSGNSVAATAKNGHLAAQTSASLGSRVSVQVRAWASTPSAGLRRGSIVNPDELSEAVATVLARVGADLPGESLNNVVVAIGGVQVQGFDAQGMKPIFPAGRHITHQDVLEVVNHSRSVGIESEHEQIQAIPREFRVDGHSDVRQPIGMSGSKLEVTTFLVVAASSHVSAIENAVVRAGARVDQMIFQPLASGLGVLTRSEMEEGAVVVDIGAGVTNLCVFSGGSIAFSASLPVGSQLVTNDIGSLLRTSPQEAERLKTLHGAAIASIVSDRDSVDVLQTDHDVPRPMQRRVLCEIIESRMREIAKMCVDKFDGSGLRPKVRCGLVLTGGGSLLPGTEVLFEELFGLSRVRTAEPLSVAGLPSTPGLGVAVGLARFALEFQDDLAPSASGQDWRRKVRSLFSLVLGKA